MSKQLSVGEVARACGVDSWYVRRLFERGIITEPTRFGRYRVIPESDLPKIKRALVAAGYMK